MCVQSTWDGLGKILHDYREGNKSDVAKLVAEHFVTIIPIAPKQKPDGSVNKHYRPEVRCRKPSLPFYQLLQAEATLIRFLPQHLDKIVAYALGNYPIDLQRFYTVGYSAGCRGVIRYNVFRPFVSVSLPGAGRNARS